MVPLTKCVGWTYLFALAPGVVALQRSPAAAPAAVEVAHLQRQEWASS
jgi:hypothetical protein